VSDDLPRPDNTAAEPDAGSRPDAGSLPDADPDGFGPLGLDERLLRTVGDLGYEEPTPVQRQAIPPLIAGRDLLAEAPTGTGKTAAFALPMLQRLFAQPAAPSRRLTRSGVPAGLVVVPTRELAMQVAEAIHKYGRGLGTRALPVYGGQPIGAQLRALAKGVDIVVATPGRAIDHLERGSLRFDHVELVVLDEADEMLDMGFAEELERVLASVPSERQTALFSATISPDIRRLAEGQLRDPVRIAVRRDVPATGEAPRVRQRAYVVRRGDKLAALCRLLDLEDPEAALVFARTRGEVDDLAEALSGRGHDAGALHGGLSQEQRDRMMGRFRERHLDVLVATDVAARGLDIGHVSHVVNYDVPSSPDTYVHRIGRTGRAGREGTAITLLEPREHRLLRNIESAVRAPLEMAQLPTVADVRARRLDVLRATLREALLDDGRDRYRAVVEPLAEEFDVVDIALAAVGMAAEAEGRAHDDRELAALTLPVEPARGRREAGGRPSPRAKTAERRPRGAPAPWTDRGREGFADRVRPGDETGGRSEPRAPGYSRSVVGYGEAPGWGSRAGRDRGRPDGQRPREVRPGPGQPGSGRAADARPGGRYTRLFIGAGRAAGVRPGDLVGAIANEAGVSGDGIGAIQIADGFSLVEVAESAADHIIDALRAGTIRGRRVNVRRERY
jgi:ATP-dependent RNA helicase DeaD